MQCLPWIVAPALALLAAPGWLPAQPAAAPGLVTLRKDAGWCWFQDERAVIDGRRLLCGTVSSPGGDIQVTAHDLETGQTSTFTLHEALQSDDHDAPALLVRPDGRYLAVYSRHGNDRLVRWRISTRPHDPTAWEPEATFDAGAGVTYANVFRLPGDEGRVYDFHRGRGFDPNVLVSTDDGGSWSYAYHLLSNPGDATNRIRPYVRYASDGAASVHFLATEAHPQEAEATSLYHGVFRAGKVYASDGALIGDLAEGPVDPAQLTWIFAGGAENRAWSSDLHLDAEGRPVAVYSVHRADDDHRYRYARWDGAKWHDAEIAHAGRRLYRTQEHYTGNIAIDPDRPDVVYASCDVDPVRGAPLLSRADGRRHYELFRGERHPGADAWTWTAVTTDSTVDNLRPAVPIGHGTRPVVLWLRGTYRSYTDYELDLVRLATP